MVVHAIQCLSCEEIRIGRDTADGVTPIQKRCPDCGTTKYLVLASEQIRDVGGDVQASDRPR